MRHGLFILAANLALLAPAAGQQSGSQEVKELAAFKAYERVAWAVAVSSDGKTVAASGFKQDKVVLWDLGAKKQRSQGVDSFPPFLPLAFSPDGKTLAWGMGWTDTPGKLTLYDVGGRKAKTTSQGAPGYLFSLAYSPDGRQVASGSVATVSLWDARTGKERAVLRGHVGPIMSVAFSPDGKTLASGGSDRVVRLWEAASGNPRKTLEGSRDMIWSVAFCPRGRLLASGSSDGTVRLWDLATGDCVRVLRVASADKAKVLVTFSPDGRLLVVGGRTKDYRGRVAFWEVASGKQVGAVKSAMASVGSLALSRDGRVLAVGTADGTVRVWDVSVLTKAGR